MPPPPTTQIKSYRPATSEGEGPMAPRIRAVPPAGSAEAPIACDVGPGMPHEYPRRKYRKPKVSPVRGWRLEGQNGVCLGRLRRFGFFELAPEFAIFSF